MSYARGISMIIALGTILFSLFRWNTQAGGAAEGTANQALALR